MCPMSDQSQDVGSTRNHLAMFVEISGRIVHKSLNHLTSKKYRSKLILYSADAIIRYNNNAPHSEIDYSYLELIQ